MNPSPFDIAQRTGNQIGKAIRSHTDRSAMDDILLKVADAKTPEEANNLIGNIIANVKTENQPVVMKILENRLSQLTSQRQGTADIAGGLDPDLVHASKDVRKANLAKDKQEKAAITLPQQLEQVEKRYLTKTKAKRLKFEKNEFGQTFLDLDKIDREKSDVLERLKEDLDVYTQQIAREYEKAGVPVPQDVLDELKIINQVKVDEELVEIELAQSVQAFKKKFPAEKFKGKTLPHGDGIHQLASDGVTWTLTKIGVPK